MNLILIEDNINVQLALSQYLNPQPEFTNLAVFSSAEEFENANLLVVPDVILLDINLPEKSGIELIPIIKNKFVDVLILMLSINIDNDSISLSLQAGADGYLEKEAPLEKIKEAIIDLKKGGSAISPLVARKVFNFFNFRNTILRDLNEREKQIAQGIVGGLSYKLIAFENNISIDTVRKYIKSVYKKLQINSKGQLVSKFNHKNY